MALFEPAYSKAMQWEGGYVDDPADPGGATNFGVSLRWLKTLTKKNIRGYAEGDLDQDGDIDLNDVRDMTPEQARELYRTHWWDPNKYGLIQYQSLADKLFCTAINMGVKPAHVLLQRALRSLGQNLVEDGDLGEKTWAALRFCHSKYGGDAVLAAYRCEQAGYYRVLVAKNQGFQKFERGWLNRAYG